MYAIMRWGSGLAAVLLFASSSFAWDWVSPVFKTPFPVAPDACGPGWYNQGPCGMVYGPNYYLVPPCGPFNGMLPGPQGQCLMNAQRGIPPWNMPRTPYTPMPPGAPGAFPVPGVPQVGVYPTHPYVRGPRDFFMWSEMMEETRGGDQRPARVTP